METLASAFIGHLIGDYILQTDWMASKKKLQTIPCLIHCLLWTLSVTVMSGWWHWIPISFLFITHFAQDRTYLIRNWMRLMGQENFATGPYAPWSMVIVDNTWHLLQIWFVWKVLTPLFA